MPIDNYFDVVFASAGDLTPVPDEVQTNGGVSYTQGYGPYYAQDPTVDPGTALFIDRAQFNQLLFDITTAIQYQQQNGAPPFITEDMNGGSPYEYRKGAIVSYGSEPSTTVNWVSAVAANATVPGVDGSWLELPADVGTLFTGGTSTGSTNAQVVTTIQGGFLPATAGNIVTFKAGFSNSAAAPFTLNVDGSGVTSVKKMGASGLINLTTFDVIVGGEYTCITDGTTLQLINPTNGGTRQRLDLSTTFYVSTTGNDSTGIGTAALPWLTPQYGYNYIASNIDIAGQVCNLSIADGTYGAGINAVIPTMGGTVTLIGNTGTPANVIFSTGANPCIAAYTGVQLNCAGGFKLTGSSYLLMARGTGAAIAVNGPMNYGAGGTALLGHINAFWGGFIEIGANYTISGGAGQHYYAAGNSIIRVSGATITSTGSPNFTGEFARASSSGTIQCYPNTFTGVVTGSSTSVTVNGTIDTNGALNIPGSGATQNTGGQYA